MDLAPASESQSTLPSIPRRLEDGVIVSVALGAFFSVAVSSVGCVYTWGAGTEGQLGHGDKTSVARPTLVRSLAGHAVVGIAAGEHHVLAVTNQGRVFSWGGGGGGAAGSLGHGPACREQLLPR